MKSAIILLNGNIALALLKSALNASETNLICADGAANSLFGTGITPDLLIGDFDSIFPEQLSWFKANTRVEHIPCQETTDLQKALSRLPATKAQKVTVFGAFGDRLDHTLSNMSILYQYSKSYEISLVNKDGFGVFLSAEDGRKTFSVECDCDQPVSLIPFDRSDGITTTGLKYPLRGEPLEVSGRLGQSNSASEKKVTVSVERGCLLVYLIGSPVPYSISNS